MKRFLITIVISLVSLGAFSQNVELSKLTTKWITVGREDIEVAYLDGAPYTGKVFAKHPNGKIGLIGEYADGKKEGTWVYWYSTGEKKRESTYHENKKEGTTYFWHQNGQVAKEITYRNDKNIDQKLWDDKGNRLKNPSFESFK
ncbi:MAG: hypothetical protein MJ198_04015 [Bacteroidales bacterium]|nr:hypothetical protein [Bacteroidales bacterium]